MPDTATMLERAKDMQDEIIRMRRQLHTIPELSFNEFKTAEYAAEHLETLGYKVRKQVAKTGLVADMGEGVTIAIRAEMDGLPITESGTMPYISTHHGVSHACGHDISMACVLGAAKILSAANLKGRVRIIMQPAAEEACDEQGKTGAVRMIDEGAIDGVAAIIALHVDATMPPGNVGVISDPFTFAPNQFAIRIEPSGERPDFDAILSAAQVVQALNRADAHNILITSFQSSSANLDQPSQVAILQGSFKTFSKEMRKTLMDQLENALAAVKSAGGIYLIEFAHGGSQFPRHQEVVEAMHKTACDLIGSDRVKMISRKTWTEDFSGFTRHLPGSLILLGGEIASNRRIHHSATFDVDESGLYVGSAVLAGTAMRLFDAFS